MNTTPCKQCNHFEQQFKYVGGRRVDVWYGWCRKRSVYPAKEWDAGRPFDVDVRRVAEGVNRSKPFIVNRTGTQADCTEVMTGG